MTRKASRRSAIGESEGQAPKPDGRLPTIVEQASVMAVNMPGFGNPYNLRIDVFDGALEAWLAAQDGMPSPQGGTSRERVEAAMKRGDS